MTALVELRGAAFGYGGRVVVGGVDLAIEPGTFLGIVGPNGSGKTTLFRGILGLLRPLAGTVTRTTRAIGYVPQRETLDALYPLTVREAVEMGAYGRARPGRGLAAEERAAARAAIARVGLAEHEGALFASLSGGQRQRALVARALLVRPELLVLDEPTSGVDRAAERAILALLRELHEHEHMAILLVSHQLPLVREAVREVLWVAGGRVQRGSPREMLSTASLDRLFDATGDTHAEAGEFPHT
jgi:ABC-type Mn2+/Zn2+ transport system ATPase subunit